MSSPRDEFQRGEAFADAINDAVFQHGPEDLNAIEQAALAHLLIITATDYVRRRNRLAGVGR